MKLNIIILSLMFVMQNVHSHVILTNKYFNNLAAHRVESTSDLHLKWWTFCSDAASHFTSSIFFQMQNVKKSEVEMAVFANALPPLKKSINITTDETAYKFFSSVWDKELIGVQEQLYVLLLNRQNRLLAWKCLFTGTTSSINVDFKLLFRLLFQYGGDAIIIAHNHPSNNLKPSFNDVTLTRNLRDACKLLDVRFISHLIITSKSYSNVELLADTVFSLNDSHVKKEISGLLKLKSKGVLTNKEFDMAVDKMLVAKSPSYLNLVSDSEGEEPEEWRDIPDWEGYYQASSFGRIRSVDKIVSGKNGTERKLKGKLRLLTLHHSGYLLTRFSKEGVSKHVAGHILIASAFVPNPFNLPEVNHKDGIKTNIRPSNLEWTDRSGNMKHAADNGLLIDYKGVLNKRAILTEADVLLIRKLRAEGKMYKELVQQFGVGETTIGHILSGRNWKHLNQPGDAQTASDSRGENNGRCILTEADVLLIKKLRADGSTIKALSLQFGVGKTTIGHILNGRNWKHLLPPVSETTKF